MRVRVGGWEFDKASYSQQGVADLLGCTRQHVHKLIRDGEIRAVRLGRRVLIPAIEIARILGEVEHGEGGAA